MTALDLAREAGQAIWMGIPGPELDGASRDLLGEERVGGLTLFRRNVRDVEQVADLNSALHAASPLGGLFVAVDQEGGRVARLGPPLTVLPPMREVGDSGIPGLAAAVGRALARELLALGFTVDFAPVVDVNTEAANPVIGDRSFGADPERVAALGAAFVEAMQGEGLMACAKHFPGHGHTTVDSHLDLPVCALTEAELRRDHLPPFAAAVRAGVGAVMTAHVVYPAWDEALPATLSPRIGELIRGELGFQGLLISDDVEMKAVAGRWDPGALVRHGLEAGIDVFLVCQDQALAAEMIAALRRRLEEDSDARAAFRGSLARIERARGRFCRPRGVPPRGERLARLGPAAHPELAAWLGRARA